MAGRRQGRQVGKRAALGTTSNRVNAELTAAIIITRTVSVAVDIHTLAYWDFLESSHVFRYSPGTWAPVRTWLKSEVSVWVSIKL